MPLIWSRPASSEYPKIWHTFSVSGENYVIQDLPLSMTEDAIKFMINHCKDDPLCEAYEMHNNPFLLDRYAILNRTEIIPQKATLACFKEGSNEILGMNLNYVSCNGDYDSIGDTWRDVCSIFQRFYRLCTDRRYTLRSLRDSRRNLERHKSILEFARGGITLEADEYIRSTGLCVATAYRCRGIGTELLRARRPFCKEFNIKLTVDVFTSDVSDRCAEKAGFTLRQNFDYDTIRVDYPELEVPERIGGNSIYYRTMQIDED